MGTCSRFINELGVDEADGHLRLGRRRERERHVAVCVQVLGVVVLQLAEEHGAGLHGNTFNSVNDNQSTVSNTKGSSNFTGEVNVTRRINQVDQVRVLVDLNGTSTTSLLFFR